MTILHIAISEKFLPPFIDLVEENFSGEQHFYAFITSEKYEYGLKPAQNIAFFHTDSDFDALEKRLARADKIILHGLWRDKVNDILVQHPEWFSKTYWFMWGGEFYYPDKYKESHKSVIKQVGHLVSGVQGDIDLVRREYGASGKFIEGWIYTKQHSLPFAPFITPKAKPTILLGNSADPSNFHVEAIRKLASNANKIGDVIVPLSYGGNQEYKYEVVRAGEKLLPDSFRPLTEYLTLDDYLKLLLRVDIAIFNHRRQQAINNIMVLFELGKKVYLREEVNTFTTLKQKGFYVSDVDQFSPTPLTPAQSKHNARNARSLTSVQAVVTTLSRVFA